MNQSQKQMVELEEFAAVCRERNSLRDQLKAAEASNVDLMEHIKAQEEVIERLKAQNARFVEEQREAKKRADATGASLLRAKDEVARLVKLNDSFKQELQKAHDAKFAAEIRAAALQAEYDARGKVIKKLRKRLHKLKKKLKH